MWLSHLVTILQVQIMFGQGMLLNFNDTCINRCTCFHDLNLHLNCHDFGQSIRPYRMSLDEFSLMYFSVVENITRIDGIFSMVEKIPSELIYLNCRIWKCWFGTKSPEAGGRTTVLVAMLLVSKFQFKSSVCILLNWMHSAIGHNVLLHWIQTNLSWKPEIVFN